MKMVVRYLSPPSQPSPIKGEGELCPPPGARRGRLVPSPRRGGGSGWGALGAQAGVTLVELIVAMVVISVAVGGVLMAINYTVLHSADPVLRQQSIAIAEAYMEEINLKGYFDPDNPAPAVGVDECPAAEASRDSFDNVCDYNSLPDTDVRDQFGVQIGSLASYQVSVVVSDPVITFGNPSVTGLRIDVTVTDPAGETLTLTGFRAHY